MFKNLPERDKVNLVVAGCFCFLIGGIFTIIISYFADPGDSPDEVITVTTLLDQFVAHKVVNDHAIRKLSADVEDLHQHRLQYTE